MKKFANTLIVAAALLCGCHQTGPEKPDNPVDEVRDIETYVTTGDNTMQFSAIGRDFAEGLNMSPELTVKLRPETRYQEFDGFGAAITGAAAFNLTRMPADRREKLLKETFSVNEGMGYSYIRVPIGGSDFNARGAVDYTCCDTKGIENFALTVEETDYIIPIIKQILEINPNVKVLGSPWSCPIWMKVDDPKKKNPYGSWVGGYLNPDYFQDYGTYFVKWIQAFEAAGIHINAVTVQNEPLNWGNSMSLYMPWDQERDFIKVGLGPKLREAGLQTKIIVFDHNYNYDNKGDQQQYPLHIYKDAEAAAYIDGAAYHSYGGNESELENIHSQAPDKNLYFTEQSIGTWNYHSFGQSLMSEMEHVCLGTVTRWCKAVIVWNYMLDDNGGPHGGPGACATCYGAVDVSSKDYVTLTKRSHFFVIGHLSKAFKAGSTRIGLGKLPTNVLGCAAENLDGTYGLVLQNKNSQSVEMVIDDGTHHFNITLPAESVTSAIWKK
ncbi:MAG: glucosylceramidase [Paludibacteraceae bacterium]|nr:glucosylceramidase [Paludibacteraceae bacterium]